MKKELELYELMLLMKVQVSEEETKAKVEYYRKFLSDKGSQVMVKFLGKRSLAYPIQGMELASSVQVIFLGNGDLIKLLNTEIQRDDVILRAITTKLKEQNLEANFSSQSI